MKSRSLFSTIGTVLVAAALPAVASAQTTTVTTTTTTTTVSAGSASTKTATEGGAAGGSPENLYATPAPPPLANLRTGVQVTEVGCMRALLVLDDAAMPFEKLVAQRLTEVDFRVFPHAQSVPGRMTAATIKQEGRSVGIPPEELRSAGKTMNADLVVFATVTSREKSRLGEFQIHEGEATVQVLSPVTGEMLVSQTSRESGVRRIDPVEAQRSAIERVLDIATREAITRTLEKAHKLIVHQAVLTGIQSHDHLLSIMDYMGKMKGVYHVRRISLDFPPVGAAPDKGELGANGTAVIEIVGAPQTETFWRAYLSRMPKAQIVMKYAQNEDLRKRYPSWWSPE